MDHLSKVLSPNPAVVRAVRRRQLRRILTALALVMIGMVLGSMVTLILVGVK